MTTMEMKLGLGRAKNLIQEYLIHKLLFPKIYFDTEWNQTQVDILAIDRTGAGDVHVVFLLPSIGRFIEDGAMVTIGSGVYDLIQKSKLLPSHYCYIAIVSDDPESARFRPADKIIQESFVPDGIGRVGILYVDLSEAEPSVHVILKPERFRSSKEIVELADQFVASHTPNWEVRE